ncbi:dihydrofolate reductase [Rapidithrix thailandica]|uniref:Dihydrofolate reductase n=1 Tax=Rapidithrix thailandica TaxID=413964 RepID=A0AAW9S720_9BACT
MTISIIVAKAQNNIIGNNNQLLWHLPNDLKFFKKTTSGHAIIMGRKTFESIGRPLPNRTNIIITRQTSYQPEGCIVKHSLKEAIEYATEQVQEENLFIIGGGTIYREALPLADKLYITEVHETFDGDTTFPALDTHEWQELSREDYPEDTKNQYPHSIISYQRKKA